MGINNKIKYFTLGMISGAILGITAYHTISNTPFSEKQFQTYNVKEDLETKVASNSDSEEAKKEKSLSDTKVLSEFLNPSIQADIPRENIENILYVIAKQRKDKIPEVTGRAVYIGGDYYLTANHVVDEKEEIPTLRVCQASHQNDGGYKLFNVVEVDLASDLALLKTTNTTAYDVFGRTMELNDQISNSCILQFNPTAPVIGDRVSSFSRIAQSHSTKTYESSYEGVDFFDKSKKIPVLGKQILRKNSHLFETQGEVLKLMNEDLEDVEGYQKINFEDTSFTSILVYNGESGGPIFFCKDKDMYSFAGIITKAYGIIHTIKTPGNPQGYERMQQTGALFSNRNAVERLIQKHIESNK